MTTIRPLRADEGLLLRRLRLSALEESPDAFSPTHAETSVHPDEYWVASARRIAAAPGFEIFIAEVDGVPVGLVSGQIDDDGSGHIGAMWADPAVRGRGVGRGLLQAVIGFLRSQHCARIELSVTETNTAAIALYESVGFTFTGQDEPLRPGSSLLNRTMRLT